MILDKLYVDIYQLDGDLRGRYKVLAARYDYDNKDYDFAYLENGQLYWFCPNKHFVLITLYD